jgi:NTE family protein
LALGGGFARGFAHLGVLSVLEEHNIPIASIAGTSIGSVLGAAYANRMRIRDILALGRSTRFRDFGRRCVSRLGLATNQPLGEMIKRCFAAERFEELSLPLAVVATDLGTGEPVVYRQGDLVEAIRASCAFPGLFEPVKFEGRCLADGGLVAPVPTEAAATMGAACVVGVSVEYYQWDSTVPTNIFQLVSRAISAVQKHQDAIWKSYADVLIEPQLGTFGWDEFGRAEEAMAAGVDAAEKAMPRLRELLDQHRRPTSMTSHDSPSRTSRLPSPDLERQKPRQDRGGKCL